MLDFSHLGVFLLPAGNVEIMFPLPSTLSPEVTLIETEPNHFHNLLQELEEQYLLYLHGY